MPAKKQTAIKKASLAEIFTANTGVIMAGIAGLKTSDENLIVLGTKAAKLSYDVRTQLLNFGMGHQEKVAATMIAFLNEAAEALGADPDLVLTAPTKGKGGSKKTTQDSLGTVGQLLSHIDDINAREAGDDERETSTMNDAGMLNKFEVAYLNKGGKPSKNSPKATAVAKAPACAL